MSLSLEVRQFIEPFKSVLDVLGNLLLVVFAILAFYLKGSLKAIQTDLDEGTTRLREAVSTFPDNVSRIEGSVRGIGESVSMLDDASSRNAAKLENTVRALDSRVKEGAQLLEERIKQLVLAMQQGREVAGARGQTPHDPFANWDQLRTLWDDTRDDLRLAIEAIFDSDIDGRKLKGLYGLDFRNYRDVIKKVTHGDFGVPDAAEDAIDEMVRLFSRGRANQLSVSGEDVAKMTDLNSKFKKYVNRWVEQPTR